MPINDHFEYSLCAGNSEAIVFVHGIGGSPVQFAPMAEFLFGRGYDCMALLLPGHGSDASAFCHTPFGAWRSHIFQAIDTIAKQYRKVSLIGHSLGGLLCLEYAAANDIDGIILINTPLAFKISLKQLSVNLRVMMGKPDRDDEMIAEYRRSTGISGACRWYEYPLMPRPFLHLTRHMRIARRILGDVKARALVVQSCLDETVVLNSARMLRAGLANVQGETLWLESSYHSYFPERDRMKLFSSILVFLQQRLV